MFSYHYFDSTTAIQPIDFFLQGFFCGIALMRAAGKINHCCVCAAENVDCTLYVWFVPRQFPCASMIVYYWCIKFVPVA